MNSSKRVTLVSPRPGSDTWESRVVLLTTAIVVPEDDEEQDDEPYLDLDAFGDAPTEASPAPAFTS